MNGILKCCGYYCAFLMIVALYFFVVVIILELKRSPFMGELQGGEKSDWTAKTNAMAIAIAVTYSHFLLKFPI